MYFGRLFHLSRNAVPVELEPCSNLAVTKRELKKLAIRAYRVRCERWPLGGRKGELVAVIGCGMNRLDNAKLASNVT